MQERTYPLSAVAIATALALLIFSCSGTSSKTDPVGEFPDTNDAGFLAFIKGQVDDRVTCADALDSIDSVRGKIIRWSGDIVAMWDDRLFIATGGGGGSWNHFVLLIDRPLPELLTVESSMKTVSLKDAIWALGRIVDLRTIVLNTGSVLTIPHLECYAIAKENDRQFARPVWVRSR
jgi:hypothetical protein